MWDSSIDRLAREHRSRRTGFRRSNSFFRQYYRWLVLESFYLAPSSSPGEGSSGGVIEVAANLTFSSRATLLMAEDRGDTLPDKPRSRGR
jgi:hypothetical protein